VRITGGAWRSRRLAGPRTGQPIRPTPDALRERAFAVLGEAVEDAAMLDLFAGTGAVGLEALSRGAARAVFVDAHRTAAAIIRRNIEALGVPAGCWHLLVQPADRAVARLAREGERFAIAWADPPFQRWELGLEALAAAWRLGLLSAGGVACLECPAAAEVEAALPPFLTVRRELSGGASRLLFLHPAAPPADAPPPTA
jgi:16S rRNA (guanine966-N2)-methyltransferase